MACVVLLAACSERDVDRDVADPSGSATSTSSLRKEKGPCPVFPDSLIDEFVAAYNGRDLEGLQDLVRAPGVEDVVAAAYQGDSSFDDVAEWARANWDANDRVRLVGYGAFHPTKHGFQMYMTRASGVLRERGIARVSTTLDAISKGCTITSLQDSGSVQAKEHPCAFYDAFRSVDDVSSDEPQTCADGSSDHGRTGADAVFTGERVLVWGGGRGGEFTYRDFAMDGFAYEPRTDMWGSIPEAPLSPLSPEVSVWTGRELIVIGPKSRGRGVLAAAYDPARERWRKIAPPPWRWGGFEGVWTGGELLLWGGPDHTRHPPRRGASYDPATDTWRRIPPAPVSGRWSHAVVWTGSEMIVWGGGNARSELADGAAYNPATATWRELPPAPLSTRQWLPLLWTGREMIVWGGSSISRSVANGAAYDPATDSWRELSKSPLRGRHDHSAVWTGSEMIAFGGYNYRRSFADGAAYDPISDSWRKLPPAPIKPRFDHAAVWTGSEMIVFGGTWSFGHIALGDAGIYDPEANRWRRVIPDVSSPDVRSLIDRR